MKLCIPVASPEGLSALLEADFGAAQHLIVLDSESDEFHAVDRAQPELIREDVVAGIQGVLCGAIHPRLLFQLQQNGIEVFGCEAETAAAALAQFRAGELLAAEPFDPELASAHAGGCCGGHEHADEHECCGGANHGDDHECCGGKGHDNPDHECCGGKGHGHEHGHSHGEGGCGGGGKKAGGGCCGGH
jgi:predicted Fe-Mo cluster-binding NifX family protein